MSELLAILWLSMRGLASRKAMFLVIVALALGAYAAFHRSEGDRVRREIEALANAMGFDDRAELGTLPERLRAVAAERISGQVIVALEPHGESVMQRESLLQDFIDWSEPWSAFSVNLADLSVNLDPGEQRAVAKGEALLVRVATGAVRRTEPRKFSVILTREGKHWAVRQIRISAPRIDEPEARP